MRRSSLLLDTHDFLWCRASPRKLKATVREAIASSELVFVSAASAWEAGIKARLGRLDLPESMEVGVEKSGFEKLSILFSHVEAAARLPTHHFDPFDRLLVAQARIEGLTLVTHDRRMEPYDVEFLWT